MFGLRPLNYKKIFALFSLSLSLSLSLSFSDSLSPPLSFSHKGKFTVQVLSKKSGLYLASRGLIRSAKSTVTNSIDVTTYKNKYSDAINMRTEFRGIETN